MLPVFAGCSVGRTTACVWAQQRRSVLTSPWLECWPCPAEGWLSGSGSLLRDPNTLRFDFSVQNSSGGEFCTWRICLREQRLLTEGKCFVRAARCRAEVLPCARCGETLQMPCLKSEVGFEAGAGSTVWSRHLGRRELRNRPLVYRPATHWRLKDFRPAGSGG